MNDDKRDIDRLLHANVDGQLSRFDWQHFDDTTARRLAAAELRPRRRRLLWPLATAAAIVLVAGAVVVSVVMTKTPPGSPAAWATVSMDEPPAGAGSAFVTMVGRPATRCEVTLHASEAPAEAEPASSSLCIVAQPAEPTREPVHRRNRVAIARLF